MRYNALVVLFTKHIRAQLILPQHKLRHPFILMADRLYHPIELLFGPVYGRTDCSDAAQRPADRALVLQLLIVADQLGHRVEVALAVLLAELDHPGQNLVPKVAHPQRELKILLKAIQAFKFLFVLLHDRWGKRRHQGTFRACGQSVTIILFVVFIFFIFLSWWFPGNCGGRGHGGFWHFLVFFPLTEILVESRLVLYNLIKFFALAV